MSGTPLKEFVENHNLNKMKPKKIRKPVKPKIRRGKRRSLKRFKKSLRFLGVNAAGLKSKLLSFKKVLADLKPFGLFHPGIEI